MIYEGIVYRPPSEAHSLLVQATIGCAWNRCTFCDMYKGKRFRIRGLDEIRQDLQEALPYQRHFRRVFLCDGDALAIPMPQLSEILRTARELHPHVEGIRLYASARDILSKAPEELSQLRHLGVDMVYIGLESGSDRVLQMVNKGVTKAEMVAGAQRLQSAGIKQSVSIIAGLGGAELSGEHIAETADALNHMQPDFVGMLVLYAGNDTELVQKIADGSFRLPSHGQVLDEMHRLIEALHLHHCYFTSAHASNYNHLRGYLPDDKQRLLHEITQLQTTAS